MTIFRITRVNVIIPMNKPPTEEIIAYTNKSIIKNVEREYFLKIRSCVI